ncbi:hypothetical protein [Nocardioides guangzhouensis]|uniref:hypothetical protein n=1 Tax=Nocardioides guangzhouensis TaxID=2497878 RepID=UPI001438333A|nr:hypothetical protein [Nocardioides guangzhouensis]
MDDARVRRYMERYGFDRPRAEALAAAMTRPSATAGDDEQDRDPHDGLAVRPLRSA